MEKNRLQVALERERSRGVVIDLVDTNFHRNGFFFPEEPLRRLTSAYFTNRMYDPDPKGSVRAREAIAAYYGETGLRIDADATVITASASESYDLLFTALAEPGDRILLPKPGYPLFEFLASFSRLETAFYPLDRGRQYRIDLEAFEAELAEGAAFAVLISPNNPTGRISDEEETREVVRLCERYRTPLIVDEVFSEFRYGGTPLARPASVAGDTPIFTLNGVSKLFAAPDLKLSWIAVSGGARRIGEIVERLEVVNDVFLSCTSLSQYLLPGLFEAGGAFRRDMVEAIDRRRRLLVERIAEIPGLSLVEPNGGIHCIVEAGPETGWKDDEELALALLERERVYVHPGYFYGTEDGTSFVLSFLVAEDTLEAGLDRLERFFSRRRA